jgi:hypothetical protein
MTPLRTQDNEGKSRKCMFNVVPDDFVIISPPRCCRCPATDHMDSFVGEFMLSSVNAQKQ